MIGSNEEIKASQANSAVVGNARKVINWAKRISWHPLMQILLCSLVALALFLPHMNTPPVRDEADYIVAAQAIDHIGVPVFYQSDGLSVGQPINAGSIPGLPGVSQVYPSPDNYETRAENGGIIYKVGNWHPPLYLYMLAVFFLLPLPFTIAARLLNFLLLVVSLALIHRIMAFFIKGDSAEEGKLVLKRVTASLMPIMACLVFLLCSYGVRSYTLIDSTSTISPTAVLVFWYIHLRSPQNVKGVLWRTQALLLVLWANLGPAPTLLLAIFTLPLIRCEKRRMIIAASSIGLALVLFGLTFEAYSLWEGIPASTTFAHSSAALARPLALLPSLPITAHLSNHGTSVLPIEALLLLLYGPFFAGATLIVLLRYTRWHPKLHLLVPACMGGAFVLALALSSVYLKWQQVPIKQGLSTYGVQWLLAAGQLMIINWGSSPYIFWFLPGLTCIVLLASARLSTRCNQHVIEMAVWSILMSFDVLFVGSPAWGFPKYMGPVYAIFVPLSVLFVHGLWTGQVKLSRWQALIVSLIGLVALGWAWPVSISVCQSPSNICLPDFQESYVLWGSILVSLCLFAVAALTATTALWSQRNSLSMHANFRFVWALVAVSLLPLLMFSLIEQSLLFSTQGPITYSTGGDVTEIMQAGQYLATHVSPGQLVVARKDMMIYAPGVYYLDDSIPADVSQAPAVVWVVRPHFSFTGFVEVARIGAWGIYYRAATG